MIILVGLGNHPKKYQNTRHNFGFLMADFIQSTHQFTTWRLDKKFKGEVAFGEINGQKAVLLKPHTLMNLSGESVQALIKFYKISPSGFIVFSDDLDQEFGKLKLKNNSSHGGQNGLRNIIQHLGTENFARLKFGISNAERDRIPAGNFVLMNFSEAEKAKIPELLKQGETKLIDWAQSL